MDFETSNDPECDYSVWTPSNTIIPVLYMLIFILGLSGNGVVIFTVWRAQGKRRSTNIFIANLAVADLLLVVTLPLRAVYAAMDHWPFGEACCKISSFMVLLSLYASVFCLTCMSYDRYLAIVHSKSTTQLHTRSRVRSSLKAIWLFSGLFATPELVFRTIKNNSTNNTTFCMMNFSLVSSEEQEDMWEAGLSIFSSALGFLLPLLIMMVCYCFIGRTITHHFNTLRKEDQRKRRLLKIITTVVVVFATCWMPFHILQTVIALRISKLVPFTCFVLQHVLCAHPYTICFAYFNSCFNPFLYAFFDPHFRSQCLCRSLYKAPDLSEDTGPVTDVINT